jgi:hypothetical protein
MPAINQIISLGLGTPSDIPHFLTLGLGIGAAALVSPPDPDWICVVPMDDWTVEV